MRRLTIIGSVVCEDIKTPMGHSGPNPVMGGSCVYASVAAQFFHCVDIIGAVGTDFPVPYLGLLQSLNIDLTGLEKNQGKTFYWKANYANDLVTRETQALKLGVYENYHPKISEKATRNKYFFIANLDPQIQGEIMDQLDSSKFIMLGTIDHWIRTQTSLLKSLLLRVDGFIANEEEMKLLAGVSDPILAAKCVAKLGAKFSIMTLGAKGAFLVIGEKEFYFPAFPHVTVKDPTGAGDSFAGGFLASLARDRASNPSELSLCRAMLYGTVLASFCVESFSVKKLSSANLEEIEKRANILRKMIDFKC